MMFCDTGMYLEAPGTLVYFRARMSANQQKHTLNYLNQFSENMSSSEDESVDDFYYSDCPSDLDDPYRFLLNKMKPQ